MGLNAHDDLDEEIRKLEVVAPKLAELFKPIAQAMRDSARAIRALRENNEQLSLALDSQPQPRCIECGGPKVWRDLGHGRSAQLCLRCAVSMVD